MPINARRVFRLSLTMALSLVCGYGLQMPLPFMAPLFALILTSDPTSFLGVKGLMALIITISLTLGIGLLLVPLLLHYSVSAILMVVVSLYFCTFISLYLGKALLGTLLTMGITMISAAGTLDFALGVLVIEAMIKAILIAMCCHWLVYPFFPETVQAIKNKASEPVSDLGQSRWLALRTTLIVLPAYLFALTNPAAYLAIIMKSVTLGQQGSELNAKNAGKELLGSTFLGGCFAMMIWCVLDLMTNLWMFFWLMLLFGVFFTSRLYVLYDSRYTPSFWLNTAITMLILLGPAVEDSANGKDVYAAFFIRMGLFFCVTVYAWAAISFLEKVRNQGKRVKLCL